MLSKQKIVGLYKLTRVRTIMEFYPLIVLLGMIGARAIFNLNSIILSISILLLLLASFVINDVEDAEDDAKDPKKVNRNPISAKIVTKKEGYIFFLFINFVALLPLVFLNQALLLVGFITAIIGYLYSSSKLRLKSKPFIDLLSHGFFLAAAQVIMYALLPLSTIDYKTALMFVGMYLFSMGGDLYNEVRDWVVDREVGLKNTASIIGFNPSRFASYFFYGIGALLITITTVLVLFRI